MFREHIVLFLPRPFRHLDWQILQYCLLLLNSSIEQSNVNHYLKGFFLFNLYAINNITLVLYLVVKIHRKAIGLVTLKLSVICWAGAFAAIYFLFLWGLTSLSTLYRWYHDGWLEEQRKPVHTVGQGSIL